MFPRSPQGETKSYSPLNLETGIKPKLNIENLNNLRAQKKLQVNHSGSSYFNTSIGNVNSEKSKNDETSCKKLSITGKG